MSGRPVRARCYR